MIDRLRKILDAIERVGLGRFLFIFVLGAGLGGWVTALFITKLDPHIKISVLEKEVDRLNNINDARSNQIFSLSAKLETFSVKNDSLQASITALNDILKKNKLDLPREKPGGTVQPDPVIPSNRPSVASPSNDPKIPGPQARARELSRATALRFGKPVSLFNGDVRFLTQDYRDSNPIKEFLSPDKCKFIFGKEHDPNGYLILEEDKQDFINIFGKPYSVKLISKRDGICYINYEPVR